MKILKLNHLLKHSPRKQNVFESWIYYLLKYGFLGSSVPFYCLLCNASLRRYNHIRSHPAGSLFASHRNAQGCLKSRTRKKKRCLHGWNFHSCTHAPSPGQWQLASVVMLIPVGNLSNTPRTSFTATSTYQWSPLQGLVPPLSLKLWKFQSFSFFLPNLLRRAASCNLLPYVYSIFVFSDPQYLVNNSWH